MKRNDKTYEGKGRTFELALAAAIQEGEKNISLPSDGVAKWTLVTISGREGGLFGIREVIVEIRIAEDK